MNKFDLNCCRICLSYEKLVSIFSVDGNKIVAEKVMFCAAVQVSEDDGLPNKICNQCKHYLDIAFKFKTVCEFTHMKLMETLRSHDLEEGEVVAVHLEEGSECADEYIIEDCSASSDHINVTGSTMPENNDTNLDHLEETDGSRVVTEEHSAVGIDEFLILKDTSASEHFSNSNSSVINYKDINDGYINSERRWLGHDEVFMDKLLNVAVNEVYVYSNVESSCLLEVENNVDDMDCVSKKTEQAEINGSNSLIERTSENNKVGRHVAKKNAGQHPRKLQRPIEHECGSYDVGEDKKQKLPNESLCDVFNKQKVTMHISFAERDSFITEPLFEETVAANNLNDQKTETNGENESNDQPPVHSSSSSDSNSNSKSTENVLKIKKVKLKEITVLKGNINRNSNLRKVSRRNYSEVKVHARTKQKNSCDRNNHLKSTVKNGAKMKNTAIKSAKLNKLLGGKFICNVCKKTFQYRSHLLRHLNTHTGLKQNTCEYCNKGFVNSYNLSEHMRKHTGNFPLTCEVCNKGFSSPSILKRHMRSHSDKLNFHCKFCDKGFRHSSSHRFHEKMHEHKPSYKCDICFKAFSYTNSLVAHRKTHSGFKPHSCSLCKKSFTRRSSLMRHMGCHCNAKKLKCRVSTETLANADNFIAHAKIQSKHECEFCKVVFPNRLLLANHLKKHVTKCECCGKKFDNRTLLLKHLQRCSN